MKHLNTSLRFPDILRLPLGLGVLFGHLAGLPAGAEARPPNIVVILSDDQGYADISFNPYHPPEVSTPHLDRLAREGVFFTQAYINGNVCSPTRAALMTGRYQQRAGIYTAGEGGSGLPLEEKIFPQFLKPAGYVTAAFGKWHLGLTAEYNPANRGFDQFYGFLGRGAHDYFKLAQEDGTPPLYRNLEEHKDQGYLTNRLTEEAVAFIRANKDKPFYVHLAYNAVHSPQQAPEKDIARYRQKYPDLSEDRVILMAMLEHLDRGVGQVVDTLKAEGLFENTLLFFLTDNGGATAMKADNTPLRGFKGGNYEGGIRTPFVVSWPARFPGGRSLSTPVIGFDILATALEAAGVAPPKEKPLDGVSLLPLLTGQPVEMKRDLFWSEGGENGGWAVRSGEWKLFADKAARELYNLRTDPGEAFNLAEVQPARVQEMEARYHAWLEQMANPLQQSSKRWSADQAPAAGGRRADRRKERQPPE